MCQMFVYPPPLRQQCVFDSYLRSFTDDKQHGSDVVKNARGFCEPGNVASKLYFHVGQ